jgi:hypothetical protein
MSEASSEVPRLDGAQRRTRARSTFARPGPPPDLPPPTCHLAPWRLRPRPDASACSRLARGLLAPRTSRPPHLAPPHLFQDFDRFFNIVFLIELLMNIYGSGGPFRRFWSSGWNVFDFFIVVIGVIFMTGAIPPDNPLSNLKMLRAFRVFRLFKRIKSLNKIVVALLRSLPGVFNAFVIMVIFMMIYAILAVEYFAPLGQEFGEHGRGQYVTFGDNGENHTISAETARGFAYGWEYYGTFFRAMYTLFQVMTGESWSEAVARPLMFGLYKNAILVAIYFVSFILLMQIVLTNVVVAVLLDKFVADEPQEGDDGGLSEGGPTASVSPAEFLQANGAGGGGGGGGEALAKPAWSTLEAETSVASSAHQLGGSFGSSTRDTGGLEAKLTLILQELAELRKEVAELKQDGRQGMTAEDLS